jgi:hypothetical protein
MIDNPQCFAVLATLILENSANANASGNATIKQLLKSVSGFLAIALIAALRSTEIASSAVLLTVASV